MKLKHLLAGTLVAASSFALAADEEVEKLLASMRKAYSGAKTAKFTVQTVMKAEDKDLSVTFEGTFKGPNKLYLYTDSMFGIDGKVKLVCDGKTISITTPEDKDEAPFTIENLSSAMPLNLESLCFWDYKRQLSTEADGNMHESSHKILTDQEWNDKKWTILEETANEQKVFVKYWIDPKTSFIWKTEVFDLESKEKVMTCEIKKLEVGLEVEDSVFDGS